MKLATVLLLLAAAAAASCRPMPGGAGRNPCEYSAHDQCISETQYCKGSQLHTCGAGLRCNFNEEAIGCEPVETNQPDEEPANPCEYSAHDQCINETQYCQGKQLHTCGAGLRCNGNEQAIGCEPVETNNQPDEEPANPCEYSAHDQCISETQYCQGKQLHTCGAGLRCNFNEQAIGCEPVETNQPDEEPANPCEYSAHDQCISETQYCQGKQLHTCGAGLRCNFNEQAIGCEPDDSQ